MTKETKDGIGFLIALILFNASIILFYWIINQMQVKIPLYTLVGCFEIMKKYFLVQEFTSVYKINKREKMIYNTIAKLIEENKK